MKQSWELSLLRFQRAQRQTIKNVFQQLKLKKWVQFSILGASFIALLSALFLILVNLLGAFVGTVVVFFVLEKIFGLRFNPQAFAQAFSQGF